MKKDIKNVEGEGVASSSPIGSVEAKEAIRSWKALLLVTNPEIIASVLERLTDDEKDEVVDYTIKVIEMMKDCSNGVVLGVMYSILGFMGDRLLDRIEGK